jgi:outer membrane protein assembly factor BamB
MGRPALLAETPRPDALPSPFFPLGIVWEAPLASAPAAWPAFDDRQAYVPLRSGALTAVSLDSGQVRWSVRLATTVPPAAGEGAVFVATDEDLVALDQADGSVRWRVKLDGRCSAPLLWDTGWLIASLDSGEVAAFRGDNGRALWRVQTGGQLRIVPAIGGDRLYVPTENGRLLALELASGSTRWERQLGDAVAEILPLDDRLFVGSKDNFFYCLSTRDGRLRWRWRVGADVVGAPVVDEARVYFAAMDNLLRALDRGHGAQRWRMPLPTRPFSGPNVVGDVVIVAGLGDQVTAYLGRNGGFGGRLLAPGEIVAPFHVVEGVTPDEHLLFILTGEGVLYAARHRVEPPIVPLELLPGVPMPLEGPPGFPIDWVPGKPVPPAPPFEPDGQTIP